MKRTDIHSILICIFIMAGLSSTSIQAEESPKHFSIGNQLFLQFVEKDHYAWSESYVPIIADDKNKSLFQKNIVIDSIESLDNPQITQTDKFECSGPPQFQAKTKLLECNARIGQDFFCDSTYQLDDYHFILLQEKCYTLR